jgi:hypothetical protein
MDEKTKGLIDEIHAINLAFQHKPFQESSEAHKAFKRKYLSLATNLQQQFPFLDLHNEIAYFGS